MKVKTNCLSFSQISTVSQLGKCLTFTAFRGVILYSVQSFLSPRTDSNFRHLFSCDTVAVGRKAISLCENWMYNGGFQALTCLFF